MALVPLPLLKTLVEHQAQLVSVLQRQLAQTENNTELYELRAQLTTLQAQNKALTYGQFGLQLLQYATQVFFGVVTLPAMLADSSRSGATNTAGTAREVYLPSLLRLVNHNLCRIDRQCTMYPWMHAYISLGLSDR